MIFALIVFLIMAVVAALSTGITWLICAITGATFSIPMVCAVFAGWALFETLFLKKKE